MYLIQNYRKDIPCGFFNKILEMNLLRAFVNRHSGFTLMELVVSIILMGIIGTIVFTIMANQSMTFNRVFNQTDAIFDARNTMRILRTDIRNLDFENIVKMESGDLQFNNDSGNLVKYEVSGGSLLRNGTSILDDLNENPFTFLNSDKDATSSTDSVRFFR